MKFRFTASAGLAFSSLVFGGVGVTRAEDMFSPTGNTETIVSCQFGAGVGSCTRFQGYVVVRHQGAGTESGAWPLTRDSESGVSPDLGATLSTHRIYLTTGDP
jgi:hypothetical protein